MKNLKMSNELCEFLGWHTGDGCISINNRYSEYTLTGDITEERPFYEKVVVPTFNKLFKDYLTKPVFLRQYKTAGVCGIYLFDKQFVRLLKSKLNLINGKKLNMRVPNVIRTNGQKRCFLRGLYDTDGSIYFCKSNGKTKNESFYRSFHYKPKIKVATISKDFMEQVYWILRSLDFSPRWGKPSKQKTNEEFMYSIVLDTVSDTRKWIEEIGFKNQKHLTKMRLWNKFGFCPPHTTLNQRMKILKGELNPLSFYSNCEQLRLNEVRKRLHNKFQINSVCDFF